MRVCLTLCMAIFAMSLTIAQTARLQVIHNSPTPTVDIYANQDLLLDNFVFRTATPFIDVPAGVNIDIGVALGTSTSAADAIATFPVQFEEGGSYVVVAAGVVGGDEPFNLFVFDMGQETTDNPENVGILFFHGSPDAPAVDVVTGGSPLIDDASFGDFQGYLEVPAATYDLDITPADNNMMVVASYEADLSFWGGRTAVIFASGFLGGDDPAFEPWVALDNGGTFPLATTTAPPPPPNPVGTRLQIIHNSPTPTVDVWVNDDLLVDNFVFRTATPFIDVPPNVDLTVGIALADSDDPSDALVQYELNLADSTTYIAVANGIVGGSPGFNLEIFDMGMETADDPENVGLLFFHGSPDAPEVDIIAGGNPVFDDVSFSEFQGYVNVPAGSYTLGVTPADDNDNVLAEYVANLDFWAGRTAVVFASGFLSGDSPGFEPWVALDNGGTFPLPVAPSPSPLVAGGSQNVMGDAPVLSPNPASNYLQLSFISDTESMGEMVITDLSGNIVLQQDLDVLLEGINEFNINVGDLSSGMYLLTVVNGEQVRSSRFSVIR